MRLEFSVLWFDDDEEYFDSLIIEVLEEEIKSWGFTPRIEFVTTPQEFKSHSPYKYFDLIVVDRNLEGYKDGEDFIKEIRGNAVYTEVIFYTAGNTRELWQSISERELEGVFVSSRNEIFSKIFKVGRQSIRKVLDLENMRGIVMAEVGELDHLLEEIITIGFKHLSSDEQKNIFQKFFDALTDQQKLGNHKLLTFNQNPEVAAMLTLCDSNKRWQNFNRVRKAHSKLKGRQKFGDYVQEILNPRNFLAHGKPILSENGSYIFNYLGESLHFDDITSRELRQKIIHYKIEFKRIITLLNSDESETE